MAIHKLFLELEDQEDLDHSVLLKTGLCTYYFSVLFTKFSSCNLFSLNGQITGGNWQKLISSHHSDNDGEISVLIGNFLPGTKINIIHGIQALTEIPSISLFIVNQTTNNAVKVSPGTGKKKMTIGSSWNDSIDNFPLQA